MNSNTEENYLKVIYKLSANNTAAVTTNGIAEMINTKAASVTDMLKRLSEKGLINYKKYQGVTLSEDGLAAAIKIIRKHRLWEVFLVDKLNFGWDEVHDIAEELEHINSDLLIDKLEEHLGFPKTDPHGDLIPDKRGKFQKLELVKLSALNKGDEAVVSGVSEHSSVFLQHLDKVGLTLGVQIKIVDIIEFDTSVQLIINRQKELTVSKEVSKNILVTSQS